MAGVVGSPCVHADFAASSAFAVADEQRAAALVEVGLAERECCLDPQTRPPEDHDESSQPLAVWAVAGLAHHGDDLLDGRWIGGGEHPPFFPRGGCAPNP